MKFTKNVLSNDVVLFMYFIRKKVTMGDEQKKKSWCDVVEK